jgi:CRISPR-associated Cas5-like protein
MKPYPLQIEISGSTALWTRPDNDSSPVSYVTPTFSAGKGAFESVLRWKSVNVRPMRFNPLRLDRGEGRGEVSNPNSSNACPPARPKPLLSGEGAFRPERSVCETEHHESPTLLRMLFDQTASFFQN